MYFAVDMKDDIENDDYKNIKEEAEKLKLDVNKFNEERIYIPDPNIVFQKVYLVASKLSNSNRIQFFPFLNKFVEQVKIYEIKEENLLEFTENL